MKFLKITGQVLMIPVYAFRSVVYVAEAFITFLVCAIIVGIGAWYLGYIPDEVVLSHMMKVGGKLFSLYHALTQ